MSSCPDLIRASIPEPSTASPAPSGMDCRVEPGNDDSGEALPSRPRPRTEKSASPTSSPSARTPRTCSTPSWRRIRTKPARTGGNGRVRAFVEVQNGCDHRCTFCIIPYGRGNSRSVPMGAVVEHDPPPGAKRGVGEVVLTGVDLTSYGADLPGAPAPRQAGRAPSSGTCRSFRASASPPSIPSRPTRSSSAPSPRRSG